MKAIKWTAYGPPDVLQLAEIEKPSPKENEILIKVCAAAAFAGDAELRRLAAPFFFRQAIRLYIGIRKPARIKILGQELAGVVEQVGKDVQRFKPGDQIYGSTGFLMGSYAEYTCLPEGTSGMSGALAHKPENLTFEEAACAPIGGMEALYFLDQAGIKPGEKVLVNGAGGSIGTLAVQLARHYGGEVTGVDRTGKLDMLRRIGAVEVIDYTRNDFTQNGQVYDVIFDVVGKSPVERSLKSLKTGGRYLMGNSGQQKIRQARRLTRDGKVRIITGTAAHSTQKLLALKVLIEAGALKPVIDRTYPLEQAAEAHRYVDTGEQLGNVVLVTGCA